MSFKKPHITAASQQNLRAAAATSRVHVIIHHKKNFFSNSHVWGKEIIVPKQKIASEHVGNVWDYTTPTIPAAERRVLNVRR